MGNDYTVAYTPGESTTSLFGGNSNWRGPIWFPINFLIHRIAGALPPFLRRPISKLNARSARERC